MTNPKFQVVEENGKLEVKPLITKKGKDITIEIAGFKLEDELKEKYKNSKRNL